MLTLVPWFLRGIGIGCVLSFIWEIHKIGKIFLLLLLGFGVIIVMMDTNSFIASFRSWEYELANFLGLMIGSAIGRSIVDEFKS